MSCLEGGWNLIVWKVVGRNKNGILISEGIIRKKFEF